MLLLSKINRTNLALSIKISHTNGTTNPQLPFRIHSECHDVIIRQGGVVFVVCRQHTLRRSFDNTI
ncbi:Uncharacterised protein [Vibrio cholerae]|nr:Uncharacterised protein [Vibrio cholerae]CSI67739.1 Uncharacterised protein [Vibrio cholerae]